jgi:hypothetical protein
MIIGLIIGLIIGGCIGVSVMCVIRINKKDALATIKIFEGAAEHEREIAIKQKQDVKYINGMGVIISLFKKYFEEELD